MSTILIGFCASRADCGKTTLLLKIVAELRARNIKVGVIKHGQHLHIDPSKDSSRYAAAGAQAAFFIAPQGWILESRPEKEMALEEAAALLSGVSGCEVVLAEGYKNAAIDKIAVYRSAISLELPCESGELIAAVGDVPLAVDLPQYRFEDIGLICDLILSRRPAKEKDSPGEI
ncbi:MAG: molybdopterin-guanine dinucleotide biosynthesis protein B [Clostridia bacterium]|nr:molybdopterin-guanine dinucleotide biosynthesis protein B [Clostridia bacterium]